MSNRFRTYDHSVTGPAMTWLPRSMLALLLIVLAAGAAGCGVVQVAGDSDDDPIKGTWDLTEPPTRDQLRLEDGRDVVVYETDGPRPVTLRLPEGVTLKFPLELLTFDSLGSAPSDSPAPTGLDAKTDRVPLKETVELYRSALEQLGMSTKRVEGFEDQAKGASGQETVKSPVTTRRYGYLELNVVAHFESTDDKGYVTLVGAWGPLLPDS